MRRTVTDDTAYSAEQRRASNEGRREIFGLTNDRIAFVCECDRPACYDTILLSAAEYDAIRPGPVAADGHAVAA